MLGLHGHQLTCMEVLMHYLVALWEVLDGISVRFTSTLIIMIIWSFLVSKCFKHWMAVTVGIEMFLSGGPMRFMRINMPLPFLMKILISLQLMVAYTAQMIMVKIGKTLRTFQSRSFIILTYIRMKMVYTEEELKTMGRCQVMLHHLTSGNAFLEVMVSA